MSTGPNSDSSKVRISPEVAASDPEAKYARYIISGQTDNNELFDLAPVPGYRDVLEAAGYRPEHESSLARLRIIDESLEDKANLQTIAVELSRLQHEEALSTEDIIANTKKAGWVYPESPEEIVARLSEPGWELLTTRDSEGRIIAFNEYRVIAGNQLEIDNCDFSKYFRECVSRDLLGELDGTNLCLRNGAIVSKSVSRPVEEGGLDLPRGLIYAVMHARALSEWWGLGVTYAFTEVRTDNTAGQANGKHRQVGWHPLRDCHFLTPVDRPEVPPGFLTEEWGLFCLDTGSDRQIEIHERLSDLVPFQNKDPDRPAELQGPLDPATDDLRGCLTSHILHRKRLELREPFSFPYAKTEADRTNPENTAEA